MYEPSPAAAAATTPDSPPPPSPTQSPANGEAKTRRIPPPCWSPDEIAALIRAYRDKWFSLHRGQLKANHWQEVAEEVAVKCPVATPKTSVQCRHKMEKLRKRYRGEAQRAIAKHGGLGRYNSPWAHFSHLHELEEGSKANYANKSSNPPPSSSSSEDAYNAKSGMKRINDLYHSTLNQESNDGIPTGIPIRIPGRVIHSPPMGQFNPNPNPNPYPYPNFAAANHQFGNFGAVNNGGEGSSKAFRNGFSVKKSTNGQGPKKRKVTNGGGMDAIVDAIQAFGEGFMRIEKAKMDMVRHVEEMRMELELKRTEMLIESQKMIVDEFAKAVTKKKKNTNYE